MSAVTITALLTKEINLSFISCDYQYMSTVLCCMVLLIEACCVPSDRTSDKLGHQDLLMERGKCSMCQVGRVSNNTPLTPAPSLLYVETILQVWGDSWDNFGIFWGKFPMIACYWWCSVMSSPKKGQGEGFSLALSHGAGCVPGQDLAAKWIQLLKIV